MSKNFSVRGFSNKLFRKFNDVVNAGSFDALNIETLVATEPDVALVGVSSDKGNAQIAEVGIPTYVMQKVAKIPAGDRKKVYYLSGADIAKANTSDWGRTWINVIGAEFAVPGTDLNGGVTVEKALEWDPDVIVVQGGSNLDELYGADLSDDEYASFFGGWK